MIVRRKNISGLCQHAGMTRQNYYSKRRRRQKKSVDEDFILELVKRERHEQPRLGCRKLRVLIRDELKDNNASIGRDRFFALLRSNGLLLERKRAFIPKKSEIQNPIASQPTQRIFITGLTNLNKFLSQCYL